MVKKSKQDNHTVGKLVAVGATVAALTAAGYVLFGPDGKKNRRHISSWAVKMKGEIIEQFEKAEHLTEPVYHRIVDEISKKYASQKNVGKEELALLVKEMKKHWKDMTKGTVKKTVKKTVAKAKKAISKSKKS